jgi:hypothetical protein
MEKPKYHIGQQIIFKSSVGKHEGSTIKGIDRVSTDGWRYLVEVVREINEIARDVRVPEGEVIFYLRDNGHWATVSTDGARIRTA